MSGLINSAGSKSGVIGTTELDYEEGTWTVTCNNGITLYSNTDLGSYTKIGRMVTCGAQVRVSNDNSEAALQFNMPFLSRTTSEDSGNHTAGSLRIYNIDIDSDSEWMSAYIGNNTVIMEFVYNRDNAASVVAHGTTGGYIMFSGVYKID
jgi:hypothetical protein